MTASLERLRRLDTCAVSDALDRLELGGVLPGVHPLTGAGRGRVAGHAVTVLLGAPSDGVTPGRHLATAAVDAAGSTHMVVVAHDGRLDCAGWGGLLSRAAHARGVAGVVVDGAVRDVGEADALGFAVHGLAPTPVSARSRVVELAWGRPVTVAGVLVEPDDLVLADADGVVVVRAADVEAVLVTAEDIAATEAAMAVAIDDGAPVSDVMGRRYEELSHG